MNAVKREDVVCAPQEVDGFVFSSLWEEMKKRMVEKGTRLPVKVAARIPPSFYTSIWGYELEHTYTTAAEFAASPFSSAMPHKAFGAGGQAAYAKIAPPVSVKYNKEKPFFCMLQDN